MSAEFARRLPTSKILYGSLNLADLAITGTGLHAGLTEGNPLANNLLQAHGFEALIGYKALITGIGLASSVVLDREGYKKTSDRAMAICNTILLGTVLFDTVQTVPALHLS